MPRGDGTGPMGRGSMTGRGWGCCTGENVAGYGAGKGMGPGRGLRRGNGGGPGRGLTADPATATRRDILQEQKELLENRLRRINKELASL